MVKKIIPLPVPVEEPDEEDDRKCPPVGAPAWMATFADMATLLMAFFVLILSFAELNAPKFKNVAGSMREAFGIHREVPVMEQPRGTTILSLDFSPSPDPSVIPEITQDTTDTESPELRTGDEGQDGEGAPGQGGASDLAEALAGALAEALADGSAAAELEDGDLVVRLEGAGLTPGQPAAEALREALEQGAAGRDAARADPASASGATGDATADGEGAPGAGPSPGGAGTAERRAALAEAELRVALRREVGEGLVEVEQREDKVFITVGAGGAFPSGQADLTDAARDIMARIAFSAMDDAGTITVTGHTDDVPLNAASPFRDNWGLAAARAASVVRELSGSGLIGTDRLTATSRGESQPVADNSTDAGRAQNRRIEIEITY